MLGFNNPNYQFIDRCHKPCSNDITPENWPQLYYLRKYVSMHKPWPYDPSHGNIDTQWPVIMDHHEYMFFVMFHPHFMTWTYNWNSFYVAWLCMSSNDFLEHSYNYDENYSYNDHYYLRNTEKLAHAMINSVLCD